MTKVVSFNGTEYDVSSAAEFFVFVPDGETEAHVFIDGRFVGKRSDFESCQLNYLMRSVEDTAKARRTRTADLTLADVGRMVTPSAEFEAKVIQVIRKLKHRNCLCR